MATIKYKPKKVEIETDGQKFLYDNTKLTSHQAQMALVLAQFHDDVHKNNIKGLNALVNSDASEAMDTILSHLVLPVIDGNIGEYNKDYATENIRPLMLNMNMSEIIKKREIIDDFFLTQERRHLSSTLLQKEDLKNAILKASLLNLGKIPTKKSDNSKNES